jgi:hypothetical protein
VKQSEHKPAVSSKPAVFILDTDGVVWDIDAWLRIVSITPFLIAQTVLMIGTV